MFLSSVKKVNLYKLLFLIDEDLADQERHKRCPFCNSPLHFSNYLRKPRGGPENLPEEIRIRHSLCCSSESCRRRVLPPSCRFLGRKVYFKVSILVMLTLKQGHPESYSFRQIGDLFKVSRQTLKRWIVYFKEVFPVSSVWQRLRGRVGLEVSQGSLPSSLVLFFTGFSESVEVGLLKLLLFLTEGSVMV